MAGVEEWVDSLYASRSPPPEAADAVDALCDDGIHLWQSSETTSSLCGPVLQPGFWFEPAVEEAHAAGSLEAAPLPSSQVPSTGETVEWDLGVETPLQNSTFAPGQLPQGSSEDSWVPEAVHLPHGAPGGEDTHANFNAPLASSLQDEQRDQARVWLGNFNLPPGCRAADFQTLSPWQMRPGWSAQHTPGFAGGALPTVDHSAGVCVGGMQQAAGARAPLPALWDAGAHDAEHQQNGEQRPGGHGFRRQRLSDLWAELDRIVSGRALHGTGRRSKALQLGRSKCELLQAAAVMVKVMVKQKQMMVKQQRAAAEERARGKVARDAFRGTSSLGLVALQLGTGQILHASGAVCGMGAWMCPEDTSLDSHFLRPLLHPEDTHGFQAFMNQLLLDLKKAGDSDPVAFAAAHLVGRSVCARMLHRPLGPEGLRNPRWVVAVTQRFTFTLASIQVLQEGGKEKVVAVLVADLLEPENKLVPVHVAHVRNLIQSGAFNKKRIQFEWDERGMDPFEMIRMRLFGPHFAKDSVLASMARNAMNKAAWIFQKTMSLLSEVSAIIDHNDVLHFKITTDAHLPFGGRISQVRVSRGGYAQKVSTSSDKSWLKGQPEASRRSSSEIGFIVVDTTQELDSTLFSMMATTFRSSSVHGRQVSAPTVVATFYAHSGGDLLRTCTMVVDNPWSVGDASDRCILIGHGIPVPHERSDTSVDEITEAMHQLVATSCQEDVPYANHVTVMATHDAFPSQEPARAWPLSSLW